MKGGLRHYGLAYRFWSYARIGYPVYISFFVAMGGNLLLVARVLYPDWNPYLFSIFGGAGLLSLASLLGWVHSKKIIGMKTDYEINPYNYMLLPGKEREVQYPLLVAIAEKLQVDPALVTKARELLESKDIKRIEWNN